MNCESTAMKPGHGFEEGVRKRRANDVTIALV